MAVDTEFDRVVESWVEDNWERIVSDLDSLVRIDSAEDLSHASENAPFGPGPRAALTRALELAQSLGFETCDVDGYAGFADLPGESDVQLGIIGHVDVVPGGPGWTFPPFQVSRKDGYLVGRGVIDDKGPILCALHAMRFFRDRGEKLPASVRIIFGANEECGMKDVPYYRARYVDPDFLFTPDAEFPVCYGEKGMLHGFVEKALSDGSLVHLEGGTVTNAVPGFAHGVVRFSGDVTSLDLTCSDGSLEARILTEQEAQGYGCGAGEVLLRIDAKGKSAHASTPEKGVNAVALLFKALLDNGLVTTGEGGFLRFALGLLDDWRGTGWNVAAEDKDFGPLTIIGSVLSLSDSLIKLYFDCRYPTTTTAELLKERIEAAAGSHGARVEYTHEVVPFLVDCDAPEVQALIDVYNEITGEGARPFTMGGGTYAREFSRGVSFGVEKPWESNPEWVGGMHGPNEGVREDLLKQATRIYIHGIKRLCETMTD